MSRKIDKEILKNYITKPWYLHPITISLLMAGWIFIFIPTIIGIVLLIIDIQDTKRRRRALLDLNLDKVIELNILEKQIAQKSTHNKALTTLVGVTKALDKMKQEYKAGSAKLKELESQIVKAESEVDIQDVGFYGLDFDVSTAAGYKSQMIELQDKQKAMVKNKTACNFSNDVTWNQSLSEGRKMVRQSVKMKLWSFNTHSDSVISKVTYKNRATSERKLHKAFEVINKNDKLSSISHAYLRLKLEELDVTHKYKEQLEHEKELLREQRAQEREEKKLQQEIARERAKLEKDETHINTELARLQKLLLQERNDKDQLKKSVDDLEAKLSNINSRKSEVDYREANARAGYVYVISNIGAFGKDIIKIGVTRRLEPLERVNELGDASVPFRFDIHALIFSDQAYKLEKSLHDRFAKERVNQVNGRKEFFKVPLEEVKKAIIEEFKNSSVEFHMQPEAKEFRQSMELLKQSRR